MDPRTVIRGHCVNHRIGVHVRQVLFLSVDPSYSVQECASLSRGLRMAVDLERNLLSTHETFVCITWALSGELVPAGIQSIPRHLVRGASPVIFVAVLGHGNLQTFYLGRSVPISHILRSACVVHRLSTVFLLGCSSSAAADSFSMYRWFFIVSVCRPVSYDSLFLFLVRFVNAYRNDFFARSNESSFEYILELVAYSYNSEITMNDVRIRNRNRNQ